MTTVPTTATVDPYHQVAIDLIDLADKLRTLAGKGLPAPIVELVIMPGPDGVPTQIAAECIDTVADALGLVAATRHMGGNVWHRKATNEDTRQWRVGVELNVFDGVDAPACGIVSEFLGVELDPCTNPATHSSSAPCPAGHDRVRHICDHHATVFAAGVGEVVCKECSDAGVISQVQVTTSPLTAGGAA